MEWRPGIGQKGHGTVMNIYGKDRTCCIDKMLVDR